MQIQKDISLIQKGFTLIEMAIVVLILAILAGIAIPSYQKFIIRNAEAEAREVMMNVSLQAKRARAKNLSYKNFVPTMGYKDSAKKVFCAPSMSDCKYEVSLTDTDGNSLTDNASKANAWLMFATPKSALLESKNSKKFRLGSNGEACFFEKGRDSDYASVDTETDCKNRAKWEN